MPVKTPCLRDVKLDKSERTLKDSKVQTYLVGKDQIIERTNMSYNPSRTSGNRRRKERARNPHAGVKHSDIIRRRGVGFDAPTANREDTRHGFSSEAFSCDTFTQRYSCIFAGNNTGVGYTDSGDRSVRVVAGTLFVTIINKVKSTDENGSTSVKDVADIQSFTAGHVVNLRAGTKYSLASTGTTNVELIITESAGYNDNWKELEDATVGTPKAVTFVPPSTATPRRPRGQSKAHLQARQIGGQKGNVASAAESRRKSVANNINSSTVAGVNPRPSGPPTDD